MAEDLGQPPVEQQEPVGNPPGHTEVDHTYGDGQVSEGIEEPSVVGQSISDDSAPQESTREKSGEQTNIDSVAHGDDQAEERKAWDTDKAETIAAAVRTEEGFGSPGDRFYKAIQDRDWQKRNIKGQYDVKDNFPQLTESEDPETYERYKKGYLHAQDKVEANTREEIDRILSPYQELYDLDPERFASMPTKQFMETAKPLVEATQDIEWLGGGISDLEFYKDEIAKSIVDKKLINLELMRQAVEIIRGFLPLPNEETTGRLEAILDDSFDKTPRQTMEAFQKLVNEFIGRLESHKTGAETRRERVLTLAGHKP